MRIKKQILFLFASFILALIAIYIHRSKKEILTSGVQKWILDTQHELDSLNKTASYIYINHGADSLYNWSVKQKLISNPGQAVLVYRNDTLKFLSDNSIPVESELNQICLDKQIVRLNTGYYLVELLSVREYRFIALGLIKKEYQYQNSYLINSFNSELGLSNIGKVHLAKGKGTSDFSSQDGTYLFSLDEGVYQSKAFSTLITILVLLSSILFLLACYVFRNIIHPMLIIIFLITIRIGTLYFNFVQQLGDLPLFDPVHFANDFFNRSLGDALINSFFILTICLLLYEFQKLGARVKLVMIVVLSVLAFEIIAAFVVNSSIPLSFHRFFEISFHSLIVFVIISIFFFGIYLFFRAEKHRDFPGWPTIIAVIFIHSSLCYFLASGYISLLIYIPVFVFFLTVHQPVRLLSGLIVLTGSAIYIKSKLLEKEYITSTVIAEDIGQGRDYVAEYLFGEMRKQLSNDVALIKEFRGRNGQKALQMVEQKYLTGYWKKFMINVSLFDSLCLPLNITDFNRFDNNYLIEQRIKHCEQAGENEELFFLADSVGYKINYIGKIPISSAGSLYLEFIVHDDDDRIGYPVLLLDKSIAAYSRHNYGYAIFNSGKVIENSSSLASGLIQIPEEDYSYSSSHIFLKYPIDEKISVVLIKERTTFFQNLTFVFIFIIVISFLHLILVYLFIADVRLYTQGFKSRIRFSMVLIPSITVALSFIITYYFIKQQNEAQVRNNINEKVSSLQKELDDKLNKFGEIAVSAGYLDYLLNDLSSIYNVDINILDSSGTVLSSSRPEIFSKFLLSRKINPSAAYELRRSAASNVIIKERIGELTYSSAYTELSGHGLILNLPYFARQQELEDSINNALVTFISIYVLLLIVASAIGYVLSNRLIKPLTMLTEKLSGLTIKGSEPIHWEEKDEIGRLIQVYNKMVIELENSVNQLAVSERESAWRDMAKQVAHEIKNPLTPMKLSLQHLTKVIEERPEDLKERAKRISQTLIEQIESLSNIASAFSDFAKMPQPIGEDLYLNEVLHNIILLYQNESVPVRLVADNHNIHVFFDKDQLIRIIHNLLKNALQAIGNDEQGWIEVQLLIEENHALIKVVDNGQGIPEDIRGKIFQPSFTTKSSGMGLGLAMSKTMIENFGGRIWFDSSAKGTTFFISLPLIK